MFPSFHPPTPSIPEFPICFLPAIACFLPPTDVGLVNNLSRRPNYWPLILVDHQNWKENEEHLHIKSEYKIINFMKRLFRELPSSLTPVNQDLYLLFHIFMTFLTKFPLSFHLLPIIRCFFIPSPTAFQCLWNFSIRDKS
jgi:hypothetical protein